MGVLGLCPFLQKSFPDVFRTLPNRFRDLSGKKVVIDGTLLTQRLHFAPSPHPYRHVHGWYRIIKELKESNVTALCVFDGKERSIAKKTEIERRRQLRRVTEARGIFEVDRLRRLRKITALLGSWRSLDTSEQARTTAALQNIVAESLSAYSSFSRGDSASDAHRRKRSFSEYWHMAVGREVYAGFREADVLEALLKKAGIPVSSSQDLNAEPFTALGDSTTVKEPDNLESFPYEDLGTSMAQGRSLEDGDLTRVTESCELVDEFPHETLAAPQADEISIVIPPDVLASTLASLYLDYRQSIPNLQAMLPSQSMVDSVATDDAAVVREEYAMSKTQQQLIEEEGKFWQEFTEHGGQETSGVAINALAEKSSIISESYERRTNPPSVETYEESKMILHAMGVPCIETSGPYEAEALASSLVIHGHADYVASEDTDVLVYGAPLIRNLSNKNGPLVVISGSDVRTALQLDQAAYIDFALLLGTDFSQRIKNVGPQRALKFIREYRSIERVLECEPQYPPRIPQQIYLESVGLARMVFQTLPPPPEETLLQPGDMDEEAIFSILKAYNLSREVGENRWDFHSALNGNYFEDNPSAS